LTSLMRKISQTVSALAILSMLSTSIASADQALTVAATAPVTTASQASPVAPGATDNEVAAAGPLSDVPLNSWAYDAVNQLTKDGIIKGYPDGTFKGNRPMTRYEAAVLAYRAVDMIEAQITAGKAVEKADMDAANKMMAAFGNELKAVERHVDALQKEADATNSKVDAQGRKLDATSKLGDATAATVRRAQFHVQALFRAGAYGQNISANVGPLPEVVNGVTYAPGSALPNGVGVGPTGTVAIGPSTSAGVVTPGGGAAGGLGWGPQPGSIPLNNNTIGQYGHGLGMQYLALQFAGAPDKNSQYNVKLTYTDRYSATNFYPSVAPAACTASTVAGAPCSGANTSPLNANGVFTTNFINLQQAWYEYHTPGNISARIGKFQQGVGVRQVPAWGLSGFVNGAQLAYRTNRLDVKVGYGSLDVAAENFLINGIRSASNVTWAQADYDVSKHLNAGVYLSNYSGYNATLWDASAINCVSTAAGAKTGKVLPLIAGQVYTAGGCGAGFAPITYGAPGAAAGLPVTGAYINGSSGVVAGNTTLGGRLEGEMGKLHYALEGTDRLGTDPTTNAKWIGNLTGYAQLDYGPTFGHPGVKGQYTFTLGGFAAGFNGLSNGFGFNAAPSYWSQYSSDWSGSYFAFVGVRKWITDTASLGLFYANMGLLPNSTLPAGSPSCPGCVISGDSRNAVFGEAQMSF
jgi:hypothetical protein